MEPQRGAAAGDPALVVQRSTTLPLPTSLAASAEQRRARLEDLRRSRRGSVSASTAPSSRSAADAAPAAGGAGAEELAARLKEMEAVVRRQGAVIRDRDAQLRQKDAVLEKQEAQLRCQSELLAARAAAIQQQAALADHQMRVILALRHSQQELLAAWPPDAAAELAAVQRPRACTPTSSMLAVLCGEVAGRSALQREQLEQRAALCQPGPGAAPHQECRRPAAQCGVA
eukprot:TRINITY_DN66016_c0_g1_i1.p1 TRINITY_DN66016_c0_g1~~TRINITY_DN66016_c0_g1_i1.p1  ORF type:complete len:229 (+),score=64.50 TRINITY_DN66016_c0_g1_i1:78-764(+)